MNCYICTITLQNVAGASTVFVTLTVARSKDEAILIANSDASDALPGWEPISGTAGAMATEQLENIAERVLGWRRP